jgi:hypothetical protein
MSEPEPIPDEVFILADLIIDGVIERLKEMAEESCDECPLNLVNANKET